MNKKKSSEDELVVLVDENDKVIGFEKKSKVHSDSTPLHRGLSVFLFNKEEKILVQKRAFGKQTWPGVWSNSCCGHPLPGETYKQAAEREVWEELGLKIRDLEKVADYRYQFGRNGIVENEICPVFMGKAVGEVTLDVSEVSDYKWMKWENFENELKNDTKGKWSEWCKEEVEFIDKELKK